jgi:hypothetical protein
MSRDSCEWLMRGWQLLADNALVRTLLTVAMVSATFTRLVTLPPTRPIVSAAQLATLKFNQAIRVTRAVSLVTFVAQLLTVIGYIVLSIQVESKPELLVASSKAFLCEWTGWLFVGILFGILGTAASIVAGEIVRRRDGA